jgi:lipoprotein-releasing system ATP-binding protein
VNNPVCRLAGVSKSFLSPTGNEPISVLRGIDLEVGAGESIAVTGPSGSGKSTLLNIIGCLDEPSAGTVVLSGTSVATLDEASRAATRNQYLGFIFQLHHLLPQCSVLENVLLPTLASRGKTSDEAERAQTLIARVGLSGRSGHRPSELSGGECLRAAIARALINRPSLLLADEPTGSLDADTSRAIGDLLFEINSTEGTSLVLVTHSSELAARAGRTFVLNQGVLDG